MEIVTHSHPASQLSVITEYNHTRTAMPSDLEAMISPPELDGNPTDHNTVTASISTTDTTNSASESRSISNSSDATDTRSESPSNTDSRTTPSGFRDNEEGIASVPDTRTGGTDSSSSDSDISTIDNNKDNSSSRKEAQDNSMYENMRIEEEIMYQNDSRTDENEDTQGTYSPGSVWDKQRRRNLIFDEERFEETFLKCLICREMYNELDKLPKMLHCHHTFCMDCLYQMYRVEGEFRQTLTGVFRGMPMTVKIQCPTCREGVLISEAELRRLPNDHTIMELLSFVSQTGKSDVQYCTKHQMQPLNFFCEPCITPVCCDCTVIDHKESKGHVVVNVDEAMQKYTPIVEETLEDINSEKVTLAEKKEALECALEDLDQIQNNLNTQVRAVFDQIREVLNEREKELYDVSESEIEKKRDILHGHMKVLLERESQLNSQFSELQKAKEDKDLTLIFTGHKSAREVLSTDVHIPTNTTKGFSVTFQFSSRADTIIKQQVANLGDIIFKS